MKYLEGNGLSAGIKLSSHGESVPTASNDIESKGRELNRRAEVIVK